MDAINDMQQAIVSSLYLSKNADNFYRVPGCGHFSYIFLQYLAFFVKDPAEKEEKMKEVLGNKVPQGLLR